MVITFPLGLSILLISLNIKSHSKKCSTTDFENTNSKVLSSYGSFLVLKYHERLLYEVGLSF